MLRKQFLSMSHASGNITVLSVILVMCIPMLCPCVDAVALDLDSFPIKIGDSAVQKNGWKIILGNKRMYSVSKEGTRTILHTLSAGKNICVGKKISLSLSEFPLLSWAWKAMVLPDDAREDVKKKNDSAAGIIVAIKQGFTLHAIKYVWSSSLTVGSIVQDGPNAYDKVIVLQSGTIHCGTWISEKVNVRDDFKRCFGERFNRIDGISIMTDSDNTHSKAEAFYTDLSFLPGSIK
jgi:Protein of unknown function (DUF3047)